MWSIQGRVSRSQYWLVAGLSLFVSGILILFSVLAIPALMFMAFVAPNTASMLSIVLNILTIPLWILSIITTVKRYHDRDKSGWWILIALIPVIGFIWGFVECGFLKGTEGVNRFGDDPLTVPMVAPMSAPQV
jgi:uncharacterized membrane protein YhaH (DUF805 family)